MSPAFRRALLWVVGSVIMYVGAMSSLSAAYADGHFVPDNEDAFYHARRILDSVIGHAPVIQFDPKIHVPEGSWLTWPWGFDTAMATLTSLFGPFADVDQANRVLMNIPPLFGLLAVLLVVIIARQVALPMLLTAVLVVAFALMPAAFRAFSVGNVDHHFAEMLVTLGVLSAGLWFFRADNRRPAAAVTLGILLGGAVALQNGLFILMVPLCGTLALRWLRGEALPEPRLVRIFAATLFLMTLAACLPSEQFRRGFFEFYTLSWFHLYVAAVVAAICVVLSSVAVTRRSRWIVSGLALIAITPLVGTFWLAGEFITGSLDTIVNISEAKSPYRLLVQRGETESTMYMTWLLVLMLPMMLINVWWAWRRRDPATQFVAVFSAFALVLFQFQYRFGVFGVLPLLLTPLLAVRELMDFRPKLKVIAPVATIALLALAYLPTRTLWQTTFALGSNLAYPHIRSTWPRFADLCRKNPGIALADAEAGHWIRYSTDCSVLANVFLLTPQHAAKVVENSRLLMLTPQQLLAERNDIRYVLVFHGVALRNLENGGEGPVLEVLRQQLAPLERELLGPDDAIPAAFKKQWEVRTTHGQIYSRLYEIVRD
jgi:hypothetical protein